MNDKTVTIYNYHENTKTWQRTVVSGVEYFFKSEKAVSSSGQIVFTQLLTVVIPIEAVVSGKRAYIPFTDYQKLEDTSGHWTINPSCNKEVVVCGECDKEITGDYRITSLKADFMKSGIISAFNDNTDKQRLRHFKVVCK